MVKLSNKSILVIILIVITSCIKQQPKQVWIYNDHGGEMLSGNVKTVSIGDSLSTSGFYRMCFDRRGNMTNSVEKAQVMATAGNPTDTTALILKIKYNYIYDQNGKKIAIIGDGSFGDKRYKPKWEFDKKGFVVSYITNMYDSVSVIYHYKYDAIGNMVEWNYIHDVKTDPDLFKYKYNDTRNMIEEDLFDENVLVFKTNFRYESFDSHNNWIKRITYSKAYPPFTIRSIPNTITRKITYY